MSSLLSPVRVIVLFLVPVLFSLMVHAEMVHADSGALPKTEIEQAVRQQLNAAYTLREWSHTLVKQTQLGPASISQLALEIVVELKEPLYTQTGQQRDGQYLLRRTRQQGERIVLKGQAVVADTGGLGSNRIQVVVNPAAEGEAGLPLGSYPAGFAIADNEADTASPAPATLMATQKTPTKAPKKTPKKTAKKQAIERERAPWDAEGDMSDYAQLGNMLINVNTLELVSDRWGIQPLAQVKNLPGRFWPMSTNYQLMSKPFGAYRASDVHTEDPKQVSLNPMAGTNAQTWVSSDLSHYISLKQGDVWAGTLDWQAGTAGAAKNLTGIGVLNNLDLIAWCEQQAFFFNPQASDKPILRIDTQTGELKEMAETRALTHKAQGSPDGCFLFTSDGRMVYSAQGARSDLHVVDLRSLDTFTLDAGLDMRIYVGTQKQPPRPQAIRVESWLGRGLFWSSWRLGWFDLANRQRINPHDFARVVEDLPYNIRPMDMLPIPGDRYVEVSYQGSLKPLDGQVKPIRKRYRLDRQQGAAVSLPLLHDTAPGANLGIVWVDENRYVYPRRKGDLDELGTWLYDVRSKKNTRLSRFYTDQKIYAQNRAFTSEAQTVWSTPLYHDAGYLVLPDKNRILFSVTRGNLQELVSVSLEGKELARKPVPSSGMTQGNAGFRLRRLHPYGINLPYGQRAALQAARQ